MDHHDDWGHWSEDDGHADGLGDGDTADLGGPDHLGADHLGDGHLDGLDGHDQDGYEDGGAPQPDPGHGPDLMHESGDLDVPGHDDGGADLDPGQPPGQ